MTGRTNKPTILAPETGMGISSQYPWLYNQFKVNLGFMEACKPKGSGCSRGLTNVRSTPKLNVLDGFRNIRWQVRGAVESPVLGD